MGDKDKENKLIIIENNAYIFIILGMILRKLLTNYIISKTLLIQRTPLFFMSQAIQRY